MHFTWCMNSGRPTGSGKEFRQSTYSGCPPGQWPLRALCRCGRTRWGQTCVHGRRRRFSPQPTKSPLGEILLRMPPKESACVDWACVFVCLCVASDIWLCLTLYSDGLQSRQCLCGPGIRQQCGRVHWQLTECLMLTDPQTQTSGFHRECIMGKKTCEADKRCWWLWGVRKYLPWVELDWTAAE